MSIPFWIFPASARLFPNTAAISIIISGKASTKKTGKGSRRKSRNSVRVIAR
jgi:hypothetical protein